LPAGKSAGLWCKLNRLPTAALLKYMLVMALLLWLLARGTAGLGYHWQWYRVPPYLWTFDQGNFVTGPLMQGLAVTLRICGVSFFLAFALGLVTALLRMSKSFMAQVISRTYLEIIRNTPLLVQLFFIYFVLSPVLAISGFTSAVVALSLFEGAYASEIFRSGIVSIHKGQWEAAASIGLSRYHTYRHVILPQAVRRILPPLTSQAVSLIKDSALVSTIAIHDLTMQGQIIIAETFLVFELWFTVALIYLVINTVLSMAVYWMEWRLRLDY